MKTLHSIRKFISEAPPPRVVVSLKWLSRNSAVAQPASAEGFGVARPRHSSTAIGGGFLAKASKNKTPTPAMQTFLLLAVFSWSLCPTAMAENAQPDDNLLKSGNFDEDWKAAWRVQGGGEDFPQGEASLDEKVFHSPPGAVKMVHTERINYTTLDQYVNVEPGSHYLLSGWMKCEEVQPGGGGAGPRLYVSSTAPDQRTVAVSGAVRDSQDWKKIEVTFESKDQTKVIILLMFDKAAGTAWFDDIRLTKEK
jgi:hypothetical protein